MLSNRRDELDEANIELAKAEKQIEHMQGNARGKAKTQVLPPPSVGYKASSGDLLDELLA